MSAAGTPSGEPALTQAISTAMAELYAELYGHDRATATTYISENIVVCILEHFVIHDEGAPLPGGGESDATDCRIGFQAHTKDDFTAAIERLTHRRVVAFSSTNQTSPGVACELFFLDAAALVSPEVAPRDLEGSRLVS